MSSAVATERLSPPRRLGVVVHPSRDIEQPLHALREWADAAGIPIVQVQAGGRQQQVAEPGTVDQCGLIVAIGGDGTALAAMRAAVGASSPVLGIACGSLGALTSVPADAVASSLDRFSRRDWTSRKLPALQVRREHGEELFALNDIAVVRGGEGQIRTTAHVDGSLFARFAGDGCIVSTPVGTSAYALAAGGPLLAPGAEAFLLTPLTVHGGFCPPLVLGAGSVLELNTSAGYGGGRLEVDGQVHDHSLGGLRVTLKPAVANVVTFDDLESPLAGLRRRRIILDSPRIQAEDDREQLDS